MATKDAPTQAEAGILRALENGYSLRIEKRRSGATWVQGGMPRDAQACQALESKCWITKHHFDVDVPVYATTKRGRAALALCPPLVVKPVVRAPDPRFGVVAPAIKEG